MALRRPGGGNGGAAGAGIFVQSTGGNRHAHLLAAGRPSRDGGDQRLLDEKGALSAGSATGLLVQGGGTLVLSAPTTTPNTYSGSTTIGAGSTLEIASGTVAGTGTIIFSGIGGTLVLDGGTVANTISGFVQGDNDRSEGDRRQQFLWRGQRRPTS